MKNRLTRRLARARALVAGRRTAYLWHRGYAQLRRERAYEHAIAAEMLRKQIAGVGASRPLRLAANGDAHAALRRAARHQRLRGRLVGHELVP